MLKRIGLIMGRSLIATVLSVIAVLGLWAVTGLMANEYWHVDVNEFLGIPHAQEFVYRYVWLPVEGIATILVTVILLDLIRKILRFNGTSFITED